MQSVLGAVAVEDPWTHLIRCLWRVRHVHELHRRGHPQAHNRTLAVLYLLQEEHGRTDTTVRDFMDHLESVVQGVVDETMHPDSLGRAADFVVNRSRARTRR